MSTTFDPNTPDTWCSAEVYSPPPSFDAEGYQARLNKIAGLSENGHPIVRVVWAGDRKKCYSKFYVTWYEAGPKKGLGLSSELRAKYKYASLLVPGTSDVIDVPPPRWVFEQYEHPGQYMESWEQARFVEGREVRPAPPPNGYYSWLMNIADHGDGSCCKEARKNKVVCWGTYRDPNEEDLEVIRKAIFLREKDRFIDTTKPLDETTLDILGKETTRIEEWKENLAKQEISDFVEENALELLELVGVPVSDRARTLYSIPRSVRERKHLRKNL